MVHLCSESDAIFGELVFRDSIPDDVSLRIDFLPRIERENYASILEEVGLVRLEILARDADVRQVQ